MPYNGVGVFNRVYQWVQDAANGINVDATRTDTDTNDIATGLTNCVTRDGQSPWLANLPAGGYKLTGLGNGSASTDSVTYGQAFNSPSAYTGTVDTTGATVLVTTQAAGDNSTKAASTAFATQIAFQAALPSQTGNSGKVTTTNGSTASWDFLYNIVGDHEIVVTTGNGYGAVNTKIRRYTTTQSSVGTAITYADDANSGASFTINQAGLYSIYTADTYTTSTATHTFEVSLNSSQLTTAIESITAADRLMMAGIGSSTPLSISRVVRLAVNDVIRPHTDGSTNSVSAATSVFAIRKIL